MEIIVGKTAGFCYGVKNAVDNAKEELKKKQEVCCLGEIVHNSKVVKELECSGMKFIEALSENTDKNKTIIRAHGVPKQTYEEAEQLGIELVDLTCPKVLKIHKIVSEYAEKDYFVYLVGTKAHPETIGTASFCGVNSCEIEQEEDIDKAMEKLKESGKKDLLVVVQTTFSMEKFDKIIEQIKSKINEQVNFEIINTICNATRIRQEETAEISKSVEYMIIIGGKNSSNTKKLYEISCKNCGRVVCIEDYEELNLAELNGINKVGIMAGASTPQKSIEEVVAALNQIC